jgi:tRNA (guanine26-N2/guanine27-N2)-dimethyltransferase
MFLCKLNLLRSFVITSKGFRNRVPCPSNLKLPSVSMSSDTHVTIVEGTASMQYDKKEEVFYNKVQVLNRDLSIQVIRLFSEVYDKERKAVYAQKLQKYESNASTINRPPFKPVEGISVLDALAATGLRSIRYLKEIPLVRQVTINDLLSEATDVAKANCVQNGVDESKVVISNRDACMLMYEHRDSALQFDVVDLDPYGSASPFLDSAVQAVAHSGLLCVTCTDMTVLSGNYPEVCFAKYGSMPLKGRNVHEMALRILLHAIDSAANKYKRHIVPWLSLSVDFYVRVFVRVYESPSEVKRSCLRRCMVHQSTQCPSFFVQPLAHVTPFKNPRPENPDDGNFGSSAVVAPSRCPETDSKLKIGGPFWSDALHSQVVVDELLRRVESCEVGSLELPFAVPTAPRLTGLLTSLSEELKDVPFYYSLPDLASTLQAQCPTHVEFKSALLNAGYAVSHFHHDSMAMKTNAPDKVVRSVCDR